jgi:hypothetical protein
MLEAENGLRGMCGGHGKSRQPGGSWLNLEYMNEFET